MPSVDSHGRAHHGNLHQWIKVWPPYMSGAGYVLSLDLAGAVGRPPVAHMWLMDEDVATGLRLYPYNVTLVSDTDAFKPWAHCNERTLLLHYQRRASLFHRRCVQRVGVFAHCCTDLLSF
jgi:hypothetical protein